MRFKLLLLTILATGFNAFSQNKFEPGYFIQDNGATTSCLIKNEDWRGSPTTFEYKLGENSDVKIGSIDNIKEFGSGESFKYIKTTLDIDQSTDVVNNLTDVRNPIMKEETLFLKVLAEGKASLYYTEKENIKRYFFKVDTSKIEQLIYKRYLITSMNIGTNERYKQQLATALTCTGLKKNSFEDLEYKKLKLISLINTYNSCEGSETIIFGKKEIGSSFNLIIRPGITFSSLSIQLQGDENINFENKTGFRIGLEAEYILAFNNSKWSVFVEPTYRNYSSEATIIDDSFPTITNINVITVDYNSIEFPMGGRHYMFLNKDAAFFLDAAVIFDLSTLDSKIESSLGGNYNLEVSSNLSVGFGAGFKFKNKYSVEARYHTPRQLLNYNNMASSYNSFSLIAGYNFL